MRSPAATAAITSVCVGYKLRRSQPAQIGARKCVDQQTVKQTKYKRFTLPSRVPPHHNTLAGLLLAQHTHRVADRIRLTSPFLPRSKFAPRLIAIRGVCAKTTYGPDTLGRGYDVGLAFRRPALRKRS
jgi:hypothetical protein